MSDRKPTLREAALGVRVALSELAHDIAYIVYRRSLRRLSAARRDLYAYREENR